MLKLRGFRFHGFKGGHGPDGPVNVKGVGSKGVSSGLMPGKEVDPEAMKYVCQPARLQPGKALSHGGFGLSFAC